MRVFAALSLLALVACDGPPDLPSAPQFDPEDLAAEVPIERPAVIIGGDDGRITGDIGPAVGIDTVATVDAFDDGTYIRVLTEVVVGELAAMTRLTVESPALIVPGLDRTFSLGNPEGLHMIGCVGDNPGPYNLFDAPAITFRIVVDEAYRVTIDSMLGDADVPMRTQFTLVR